jgi:DNA-binding YbaB/EbfC family protein
MGTDMNRMLKQVQQMQSEMQRLQEEVGNETVEATAGGGMVTVEVSGAMEVVRLSIKPEAIDPDDPQMLEDMITAAVNEGLRSAERLVQAKIGKLAGGLHNLGLPGL